MLTDADHPREIGLEATEITSFLPSQKSWVKLRDQWPAILFTLDIKKAPNTNPALPAKIPFWYRQGFLLLD